MAKLFSLVLALVGALSLAACGNIRAGHNPSPTVETQGATPPQPPSKTIGSTTISTTRDYLPKTTSQPSIASRKAKIPVHLAKKARGYNPLTDRSRRGASLVLDRYMHDLLTGNGLDYCRTLALPDEVAKVGANRCESIFLQLALKAHYSFPQQALIQKNFNRAATQLISPFARKVSTNGKAIVIDWERGRWYAL